MKKLRKAMFVFTLAFVGLGILTQSASAGIFSDPNLQPLWVKVLEVYGYLKGVAYLFFAWKFISDIMEKLKDGGDKPFDWDEAKKWGGYIILIAMLEGVGLLLGFVIGADAAGAIGAGNFNDTAF